MKLSMAWVLVGTGLFLLFVLVLREVFRKEVRELTKIPDVVKETRPFGFGGAPVEYAPPA